ncbi:YqzM family protein [Salinicoccus albus]|nr:YqzM family protein [Salinicoccus albus]
MNKFEKNVQSKNNDIIDSGMGFIVGFVGLSAIYIIAQVFQIVSDLL